MTKEQINQLKTDENVLYIYEFESAIEKQFIADSRSKYVIVVKEGFNSIEDNVTTYTISNWFNYIEQGKLITFKCNCLQSKYVLKEYVSLFPKLNVLNLREEVTSECLRIKECFKYNFEKKHFALCKDLLYKSLQYVLWGIQIMINNKIIHLDIPDDYFIDIILNPNNDYKYYEEIYLNKLDKLLNEFKSYSENEYQEYKRKQIIEKNESNNI